MTYPTSTKGFLLYGIIDEFDVDPVHTSSALGELWTWTDAGVNLAKIMMLFDPACRYFDGQMHILTAYDAPVTVTLAGQTISLFEASSEKSMKTWLQFLIDERGTAS